MRPLLPGLTLTVATSLVQATTSAQTGPGAMGAPAPEGQALVEAPKAPFERPKIDARLDGTTASVSAGGMLTTGNSRNLALSASGQVETRARANGLGASLLGNYGQGATAGRPIEVTTQNVQGRIRYDRYLIDELALFVLDTGRHDRFQGLDFRYNLDPGVKYLFLSKAANTLWAEVGYDLQVDVRRAEDRVVLGPDGQVVARLDKTRTDHSSRLFVGFKHGFGPAVTLVAGAEYLQSFVDLDRSRLNGDAVVAAKIGGGLALGFGCSARFDHRPLPGKQRLDTSSTLSLVYAFSDVPVAPPAPASPPPG